MLRILSGRPETRYKTLGPIHLLRGPENTPRFCTSPMTGREAVTKALERRSSQSRLGTHHNVCPALSATPDTDCVFEALYSVGANEGALYRRLTYIRRKNLACCRRTVHIEPRAVNCCLNRQSLTALKHVLLRLTSRCKHGNKRHKDVCGFIIIAPSLFVLLPNENLSD